LADQVEATEGAGRVPFVVVVTRDLDDPYATAPLLRLVNWRKPGVVDRNHAEGDPATYQPLPELGVPTAAAYLLVDIERGEEFCGVRARTHRRSSRPADAPR
jgi:hypothetical protein